MRVQPYVDAPLSQAVTSRGNMNNNISSLNRLAQKPERFVIGLMSGTSLDGLDVALCRIGGAGGGTTVEVIEFDTVEYNDDYRQRVLSVFSRRDADLETVCVLNAWIGLEHADIVLACLERWQRSPADVDLVASHGQTIYHAPTHFHGRPSTRTPRCRSATAIICPAVQASLRSATFVRNTWPPAAKAHRWPCTATT